MSALALILTLAGLGAASTPPERRPITEKDLVGFRWVADPQISPDGRQIAYVRVTVNEKEDRYETSIWAVATSGGEPRRLTSGSRDSAPRWSPDARALAFLRAGEKDPPQIYILSMDGGEGHRLTDLPKGASAALWSPDGATIAFTSETLPEDLKEKEEQESGKGAGGPHPSKKSDVRVISRAVYRANGDGWLDPKRHSHIWTVKADASASPVPRQVTSGAYDEDDPVWSRDGSRIYVNSDRVDEPYYAPPDSNVYSVPFSGGALEKVIDIDGPIFQARPAPDGLSFAFVGFVNPPAMQSFTEADLFLVRGGRVERLTKDHEFEWGSNIIADQHPPRGGAGATPLVWAADGKSVIMSMTNHGRSNLARVDVATHRVEGVTSGDHDLNAYSATPDGSKFALSMADDTHLGEIYFWDGSPNPPTRLTHENDALLAGLDLSVPEEITYPSFDGVPIQAWVLKPPGFTPGKKYPLILNIHGGPHTAYGRTFFHEFQWMAARGYVVLAPNPRGSTSYGEHFANVIQYRYPGDDYKDLMAGVDELVRRGYVDEAHMGVTGGSGGGLLTNWIVTQTQRFAAAVSQRSIGDWSGFWYTTDFSMFTPFWFKSTPFHDPKEFLARSPVRYAERITTPLMLIEGEADLRTPSGSGGESMFRALKAQKKRTVMVTFPEESHELSRSGKPSHRIERLHHIVSWFDLYLQGREVKDYPPF